MKIPYRVYFLEKKKIFLLSPCRREIEREVLYEKMDILRYM